MIIYTTNILALPLMLLIWIVELFLVLSAIRLALSHLSNVRAQGACTALQRYTDPVPEAIHGWLSRRWQKPVPAWLPWLIVIVSSLLLRHFLIWMAVRTF